MNFCRKTVSIQDTANSPITQTTFYVNFIVAVSLDSISVNTWTNVLYLPPLFQTRVDFETRNNFSQIASCITMLFICQTMQIFERTETQKWQL